MTRRAVRQAPMPHNEADEISLAELRVIDVEASEAGMALIQELLAEPPEPLPGLIEAVKRWRKP